MLHDTKVLESGSRFADDEEFRKASVLVSEANEHHRYCGVVMSNFEDCDATAHDETHTFVIGESGCGKTRRIVMPTVVTLAKTGQSMVVSDPKGEIYRNCSGFLKKNGYSINVVNLNNPTRGHGWNPFYEMEILVRSSDPETKARGEKMLLDILETLKTPIKHPHDPFWENVSTTVILGIIQALLDVSAFDKTVSFRNIRTAFNSLKKDEVMEILRHCPFECDYLNNMSNLYSFEKTCNTVQCIISEIGTILQTFCPSETMLAMTDKSEFEISDLASEKHALFIIVDDDSKAMYPLATLLVKQVYSILKNIADNNRNGKLDSKVTFILDEFANFVHMEDFDSILTASRSRNIGFVLICQSMEQLYEKYGEYGAEIIMSNCRVWMYMNCRNVNFIQRLQYLLGNFISEMSGTERPLISVQNMLHFKEGQVLVLNDRCNPYMGHLKDFSKYKFAKGFEPEELPVFVPDLSDYNSFNVIDLLLEKINEINSENENQEFSEDFPLA